MKIHFALIPWICWLSASGQDYKLNQRYPGYFINAKGDTIRGYILLINKLDNQGGTEYSNDSRGEKIKIFLLPEQVRGFKVQDRIYRAADYGEPSQMKRHFLLVREEGELTLCEYFRLSKDLYVGEGSGQRPATGKDEQYLQSEFVIINRNGKLFPITGNSDLLKHAESLFGTNEALLKKIKEKEKNYRYADLPDIVKEFNSQPGR